MKIKITDDSGKEISTDFIVQELSKNKDAYYIISLPFNLNEITASKHYLTTVSETLHKNGLENFMLLAIKENNIPIIHEIKLKEIGKKDN